MTGRSLGSSAFHSAGKRGSYPIGIYRSYPPGSQGIFERDLGLSKILDVALGILFERSEPIIQALQLRFQIACKSRQFLLNGSFGQIIY